MPRLHLNVLQNVAPITEWSSSADALDATNCRLFNPMRHDFRWNDDFTAFRPVALKWWDDASYMAYQHGTFEDEMALGFDDTVPAPSVVEMIPETLRSASYDDLCPF